MCGKAKARVTRTKNCHRLKRKGGMAGKKRKKSTLAFSDEVDVKDRSMRTVTQEEFDAVVNENAEEC